MTGLITASEKKRWKPTEANCTAQTYWNVTRNYQSGKQKLEALNDLDSLDLIRQQVYFIEHSASYKAESTAK